MGFAASTGGSTDIHEVRNIDVQPLFANPPQITMQLTDNSSGWLVQGTPATYTASGSLTTAGGSLNQPASLVATLPAGVVPGTASGTNWSCTTTGQTVNCDYTGSIPIVAGTTLPPVTIPANVTAGTSGPATATAQIVSDDSQIAAASDAGTIHAAAAPGPVLGVNLSDSSSGSFSQGGTATYTALGSVSSGGSSETKVVTLTDTLPTGFVPGTATGTSWSCGTSTQTVTCTYTGALPIAAGTVLPPVTIPATISNTVSGGVVNTVSLSSSDATTAQSTDNGAVTSVPVYGLTLTDSGSGNIPANGTFTYKATPSLAASGGNESLDPTVTLALPTGVTASAGTGTGWTCSLLSSNSVVSCVFSGTLPAPGSSFAAITVTATTTLSTGNISSSATVTSPDGQSASATDSANVAAPPPPVLSVQSSGPSLVYAGTSYALAISPSITSGTSAHDPVVTAILAAGETFAASSTTQSGYTCARSTTTVANDTLTCTSTATTPVPAGSLGAISATVTVASGTTGSPAVSVKLSDAADNATPSSSGAAPTVVPVPVLVMGIAVTPPGPSYGSTVQVTGQPSLSAVGGPALSAPTVTMTAPAGATFPADPTPSGYSCILNSSVLITCSYTGPLAIASGANLPAIVTNAAIGAVGTLQFGGSLADTSDGATTTTGNGSVTSVQAPQAITFTPPTTGIFGGGATLSATGGASGNPVTFTIDGTSTTGACSLAGCHIDLHRGGQLRHRRQPGRQHQLRGRSPGPADHRHQ